MGSVKTIKMYKGEELLVCNESDSARFEAEGWGALRPAVEAPVEPPVVEAPAVGQPKSKKR